MWELAQIRKLKLGMFVVRLVRVFRGLLFRAIYGVGSGRGQGGMGGC